MNYCDKTIRQLTAAICLTLAGSASQADLAANESPNMIINPGFEASESFKPWGGRNWWSREVEKKDGGKIIETNEFSFSLDKQNPHSGTQCAKISMTKFLGGDIQFFYSLPEIKAGMPLRLSFWIKGQPNTHPITVVFRRDAHPWSTYFSASAALTGEWKEYVFNLTLPPHTTSKECSLMFHLSEAGTFWLDDVDLRVLPAVEPVIPQDGNRIANGSFESGRDKWYATFRENETQNAPEASENNCSADIKSVISPDAPEGCRTLSFEVFPQSSMELTSAFFPLKYGHETTIEFSMKTSIPAKDKIEAGLLCGEFPNFIKESKIFKCDGTGWQKFIFKVRPKPSTSGSYTLCFSTRFPGIYLIDNVKVWQGSPEKSGELTAPDVGWEPVDDKHPANFFVKGEKPVFKLLAKSGAGAKNIALKGNIVDTWEREIAKLDIDIPLDSTGTGEAVLKLPECARYGTFKASLHAPGSQEPSVEILYSVPHEQSTLVSAEDSFFGGHVNFSPYNLMLAQKAGMRWLRLHPPLDTKWCVSETRKGRLAFHTKGAARASSMGFKLLGNLDSPPEFYADKPASGIHNWYHNYPPRGEAGWQAYEAYVAGVAKAFSPYINTWEIGNEPDGDFLKAPPGMFEQNIYMEYARRANKALTGNKDITLIGGAITGAERPFMGQILKLGVGNYIDVISFHHYDLANADRMEKRAASFKNWSAYKNRKGVSMPIWHTEGFGGGFGSESYTWLSTTGAPYKDSAAFHQQWKSSGVNMQSLICFKALGIKKHFLYQFYALPSGRIIYRNECSFMTDINGLPLPCLTAHAAAAYFLDGAEPKGLKFERTLAGDYGIASFVRDGKKLDVVWSDIEINMNNIAELRPQLAACKAFDMMGNHIESKADLRLSAAPVYLLEE